MSTHKNAAAHNKIYREKHKEVLSQKSKERYKNLTTEQKEKKLSQAKESYEKHKNKILIKCRKQHLVSNYKMTSKGYLELLIQQKNTCAICGEYETRVTKTGDIKPLSVDHNHITGKVRALLCNDCNALIGFAKENQEVLKNAITYLQKYK